MRIIAGSLKGRNLLTLKGNQTRPTMELVRESIFSSLYNFAGKKILDLFAGSGIMSFEALSRGAVFCDLVENSHKVCQMLKINAEKLTCEQLCNIYFQKVEVFLKTANSKYDIIFLDPPYEKGYVNKIVKSILEKDILNEKAVIVLEHSAREPLLEIKAIKQKKFGRTMISFINKEEM